MCISCRCNYRCRYRYNFEFNGIKLRCIYIRSKNNGIIYNGIVFIKNILEELIIKKIDKVLSRLLGPVIFGQLFAEVVEFGLKAFGVDKTVTDIVFIASFLIMATILCVNKTVQVDINMGRDYIVRVYGYGHNKPIELKIYAENENEARLNAFHHMAIKYGADFIISSIEVVKE